MREQKWEKSAYSKGFELQGKTLGVIGYGRIGRLIGEKAQALGMIKMVVEANTDLTVNIKDEMTSVNMFKELTAKEPSCDLMNSYDGTLLTTYLKLDPEDVPAGQSIYDFSNEKAEAQYGVHLLDKLGFNDTYCIAVPESIAEKYNLTKVSDLAAAASELRFGAEHGDAKMTAADKAAVAKATAATSSGAGKTLIPPIPQKFDSPVLTLGKLGLIAWFATQLGALTGVSGAIWALVLGVLFTTLGFLDRNSLHKANSYGIVMFALMMYVFDGLKDCTPAMVRIAISVGKRPLQGTKLFVRIASSRSRGESMIRHPIIPAALHPKPMGAGRRGRNHAQLAAALGTQRVGQLILFLRLAENNLQLRRFRSSQKADGSEFALWVPVHTLKLFGYTVADAHYHGDAAGIHQNAVHQDGASSALALLAAAFHTGGAVGVSQNIQQPVRRAAFIGFFFAV